MIREHGGPAGGEALSTDESYLSHPAYKRYVERLDRLHEIGDTHPWTLEEVKEKLGKDAQSFSQMEGPELFASFFMMSHRLKAEHIVVVLLEPFEAAIPQGDVATRTMMRRQMGEEEKHEEGVFNYYEGAMGMTDREQIIEFAQENSDPVSEDLYGGLTDVLGDLQKDPSLHNLKRSFAAYQIFAEGVVAYWFSKATVEKMKKEVLDSKLPESAIHDKEVDETGEEIEEVGEEVLEKTRFPGFLYGHQKVTQDESRHIAFGLEFLRMQYEVDSVSTLEAILDVALDFKRRIDHLLEVAIEADLGGLTQLAYGKSPVEIHSEVDELTRRRLKKIHPQIEQAYLDRLTQAA